MIEEDDGTEALLGSDMEVLLMDFSQEVVFCLRLHDPVTEQEGSQFFFQDGPEIFPSGPALSSEVETWIQGAAEDRVGFYSAVEEELPPRPAARPKGQAAPKKGQKKPSVANLAEQLASLSSTLAPMMSQLQALQEGQRRLEGTVEAAHTQQRTPAYRQSFVAPSPKTPSLARSRFMEDVGPPPRIKQPPSTPAAGVGFQDVVAGEEPNVLPSEEGYLEQLQAAQTGQPDLIPQLLLQQSQALTALVSQLSNQDMLGEIGPSSSSTSISMKGSARRERLLNELAQRKGNFMLRVAQNAFRRLKPADPVPAKLEEFGTKPIFAKYLERQGGFSGARDLGLIMWLLAQVADQMLQQDHQGSMELMALVLVTLEQAAMDGNKWEVAWLLSLQEDPPRRFVLSTSTIFESSVEGILSIMSSGVGCNHSFFCERMGHYINQEIGDSPSQKGEEGRGGQAGTETPAKESKEAQKRRGKRRGNRMTKPAIRAALPNPHSNFCGSFDSLLFEEEGHASGKQSCAKKKLDQRSKQLFSRDEMQCNLSQDPQAYVPGSQPARFVETAKSAWDRLQEFSFSKWCRSVCSKILTSRTAFSQFVRTTLHIERSSLRNPEKVLFPLPIPKTGVFEPKKYGSRARKQKSFDQAFHCSVMALNYLHADFRFVAPEALAKEPSEAQVVLLRRLRGILRAFGDCSGHFSVPGSGRRSTSLVALLADLSDFLTWEGLGSDGYHRGFHGAPGGLREAAEVVPDLSRAEELCPYRSLDASRLKITGEAKWDPQPYLSDSLWLAFVEPASLIWTRELPLQDFPDLTKESYESTLSLAKIWDARGLLHLRAVHKSYDWTDGAMRFFNNYKNAECDRMIGDRRLRNWFEAKIPSVSRGLPTASLMSVLEVGPRRQCLRICAADRRDFYHQFKVSEQRAATNGLWPLLSVSDLEGTQALAAWQQHKHGPYVRTKHGDQFGRPERRSADRRPQVLQACFSSIPQGDHLGVEFATDAHKTFLEGHGLFCQREDLRADSVFRGTEVLQGLVIDDFFTVSVETADKEGHEDNPPAVQSRALQRFQLAKQAYQSADLKGSDDKDLVDLTRAKVIGGEIDSACSTRRLGLTTLAAPAKKRLALAYLSAEIAQLPYTTDALHVCLLGGWVHALMYRRPLMCVLDKVFKLVDATKLDADKPNRCLEELLRSFWLSQCWLLFWPPILQQSLSPPSMRQMPPMPRVLLWLAKPLSQRSEPCGGQAEKREDMPECSRGQRP